MVDSSEGVSYDFYLHFHDSDLAIATEIVDYLEKPSCGGFKGFILERDAETGTKSQNLDIALRRSRLILVLLSSQALENRWFNLVLQTCFSFHLKNNTAIVPIYAEKIQKPDIFKTIYSINYSSDYFWNKLKNRLSNSKS